MHAGRHRSRRFPTCDARATVMQVGKPAPTGAMQARRHRSRRFPTCEARSTVMQVGKPAPTGAMQAGRHRSRRFPTCDAHSTVMQVGNLHLRGRWEQDADGQAATGRPGSGHVVAIKHHRRTVRREPAIEEIAARDRLPRRWCRADRQTAAARRRRTARAGRDQDRRRGRHGPCSQTRPVRLPAAPDAGRLQGTRQTGSRDPRAKCRASTGFCGSRWRRA